MPVQSSYIWNHGVKMWIYGYAKYKRSLIVKGVSERWWKCCQTSFSLLLFLPNKNWRRGGGDTSLWTLMDQVFDELPKVQDWVRCRPPSVAHPRPPLASLEPISSAPDAAGPCRPAAQRTLWILNWSRYGICWNANFDGEEGERGKHIEEKIIH